MYCLHLSVFEAFPDLLENSDLVGCRLFFEPVSYTHLRAHETVLDLVCRLLLEKKNNYTYCIHLGYLNR